MSADVIFGIITAIVGVIWIALASQFQAGTKDGVPGAGYFPILVAAALILLSIVIIIQGIKNKKEYFNLKEWGKENIKMFLMTIGIIAVFFVLWVFTHYIVACLFMTFCLGLTYKLGWKKSAVISVIFSLGTYFVFNNLLHVILQL